MTDISQIQALELIDIAAKENRLYHHNGGQAYIRLSMDSNALMIIDHTMANKPEITLHDGTEYFNAYPTYNIEHSRRLRDYGSLAQWYVDNYVNKVVV